MFSLAADLKGDGMLLKPDKSGRYYELIRVSFAILPGEDGV